MKRKLLGILLMGVLLIGLTGCGNVTKENDSTSDNKANTTEEKESITSNQTYSTEQNEDNTTNSNDYYIGTYYMSLTDGTLTKDGTGTIILNKDGSCSYIYGQSNMGCISYTVNDHLIILKATENSSDIYLTLDVDNKILIDANNEKYIKE